MKKESQITFIILHYLVIEETNNCIKSIINNIDTKNYQIIVVDNASPNNTGLELQKKYKNNKQITVLLNEKNLGFTGGNNIGFKYAKEQFNPDFICMMNNDTEIIQKDFLKVIEEEYKTSNFAVLGPEIRLLNDGVEPLRKNMPTYEDINSQMKRHQRKLIENYLFIESLDLALRKIVKKLIGYKGKINTKYINKFEKRCLNPVLHGCCLIFSKQYIDKFDGLQNKTFLYKEEELLMLRLIKNNLISVYNPDLLIFHAENKSTDSKTKKNYKKRRFVYKYNIKACKALLEEMRND